MTTPFIKSKGGEKLIRHLKNYCLQNLDISISDKIAKESLQKEGKFHEMALQDLSYYKDNTLHVYERIARIAMEAHFSQSTARGKTKKHRKKNRRKKTRQKKH